MTNIQGQSVKVPGGSVLILFIPDGAETPVIPNLPGSVSPGDIVPPGPGNPPGVPTPPQPVDPNPSPGPFPDGLDPTQTPSD